MSHSFLLEAGLWNINGNWLDRNQEPIAVTGTTLVSWESDNWFAIITKLIFPNSDREDISSQCRGRLDSQERYYTYVLKQSVLGRIEGEGWLLADSLVQHYWVLQDSKKRSGFDTYYQIDRATYFLSSGILFGYSLNSTMTATLKLQN